MTDSVLARSARLAQVAGVDICRSTTPVDYVSAVRAMEAQVEAIIAGQGQETIWLLEHPPILTAGSSSQASEVGENQSLPVVSTNRGGKVTYHGPGQRVVYVMLRLKRFDHDIRRFIYQLEQWIIDSLKPWFSDQALLRSPAGVGIWLQQPQQPLSKIAAIGVRVRRQVSYHGFCVNICPDLSVYTTFIPCGLDPQNFAVTSLAASRSNPKLTVQSLDQALLDLIRQTPELQALPRR